MLASQAVGAGVDLDQENERLRSHRWNRILINVGTFLRSVSTGAVGILISLYFKTLNFNTSEIGFFIGFGLIGNALGAALATFAGSTYGRRNLLAFFAILGGVGGIVVASNENRMLIGIFALLGMINGNGKERGPGIILEQAILAQNADKIVPRTKAFAIYNLCGDFGHGVGAFVAMVPSFLRSGHNNKISEMQSLRIPLIACGAAVLASFPLSTRLNSDAEPEKIADEEIPLSPRTRTTVLRLSFLFFLDAVGGGFISSSWLSLFFKENFNASELLIGLLFIGARFLNGVSHIGANWLSLRIGLVNTMVFTSLPSSLLILTMTYSKSLTLASIFFLAREGINQMDVPTRQSYMMAIVPSGERARVSGLTQFARLIAWAITPFFTGWLLSVWAPLPFVLGALFKVLYAILLYVSFKSVTESDNNIVSEKTNVDDNDRQFELLTVDDELINREKSTPS